MKGGDKAGDPALIGGCARYRRSTFDNFTGNHSRKIDPSRDADASTRCRVVCIPVADFTPDTDWRTFGGHCVSKAGKTLSIARRFANEATKPDTTARAGDRRATAKFGDARVSARKLVTGLFHSASDVALIALDNLPRCCFVVALERARVGERNFTPRRNTVLNLINASCPCGDERKKCPLQPPPPLLRSSLRACAWRKTPGQSFLFISHEGTIVLQWSQIVVSLDDTDRQVRQRSKTMECIRIRLSVIGVPTEHRTYSLQV